MTLAIRALPGERGRDANRRRAAPASSKATARNGEVSSVARIKHWSRYGAPGEQQHLPDWLDTTATRNGAFGAFYDVQRREIGDEENTDRERTKQADDRKAANLALLAEVGCARRRTAASGRRP